MAVRAALQRRVEDKWTIKFTCARARSCGCPFALEYRHAAGSATVEVWQTEAHQLHDPSSAADLGLLSMAPEIEDVATFLLGCGIAPHDVWVQVCLKGKPAATLEEASNARTNITLAQVRALSKRVQRSSGYGHTSDAAAVAHMAPLLQAAGVLKRYQSYVPAREGEAEQPLVMVLQLEFQERSLAAFGSSIVFMDSTGGTNKYGYSLCAMVVSAAAAAGVQGIGWECSSSSSNSLPPPPCLHPDRPNCPVPAGAGRARLRRAGGVHDHKL